MSHLRSRRALSQATAAKTLLSRRTRHTSRKHLGVESLEDRRLLSGTPTDTLSADNIGHIVWNGEAVDVRDGYWNGRFESATPYGFPALPPSLLPDPTWTTMSLGEGFFTLSAPQATPEDITRWATATPSVLAIEPDLVFGPPPITDAPAWDDGSEPIGGDVIIPDDPGFPNQWSLSTIHATSAWSVSTGSRDVIVAVVDSGIDLSHPDLAQNLWINPREIAGNGVDDDNNGFVDDTHGWNFIDVNNNVQDVYGHGSHVAGIIGAVGNNNRGITGINWQVSMMPLKILNDRGVGTVAAALAAINYITVMRRDFETNIVVSNNSWGATTAFSQVMDDAIHFMGDAGVTFVAAAGNSAASNDAVPRFPSSYDLPNIIAVAATDSADKLASYSNYGANSVDIGAPGSLVYSTFPGGNYGYLSGTSMATPQVTGAIALLAAAKPGITVAEVRAAILGSADTLPALVGKTVTGGRLNLNSALQSLGLVPVIPPPPPPPAPPPINAVLPFSDSFNNPDSSYLSGYWTSQVGLTGTANQEAASKSAGVSLTTLNGVSLADSNVQAFVNIRTGTSVGLVARHTGNADNRMYAATLAASGTGFIGRIWRNAGAAWAIIGSGNVTASSGILRFEVVGSSQTLFLNGVRITAAFDTTIVGPGTIGMRSIGFGTSTDNYAAKAFVAPVPNPVTLPFTDDFNRADNSYVSADWTKRIGNVALASNVVVSRVAGPSIMTLTSASVIDSVTQAFVNVGTATSVGLVARYAGAGDKNMYLGLLARENTRYFGRIWRHTGPSWTLLSSGTAPGGSGTLRLETIGSALTLFLNGKQLTATSSTTITGTGAVGIRFVGVGATADNFSATSPIPPEVVNASVPFVDDFNRADSPFVSGEWTRSFGNIALTNNRVVSRIPDVSVIKVNGISVADSRTQVFADVGNGSAVGLVARYTGSGDRNMYTASLSRSGTSYVGRLWRNIGIGWQLIGSGPAPGGVGVMEFDVIGSSLTLSLDGVVIATARDTAIARPGAIGIRFIGVGAAADNYAVLPPSLGA